MGWAEAIAAPRACVRCHAVKDASRFPARGFTPRPTSKGGIARVCWACLEGEAHALNDAGWMPHLRLDWEQDGVPMRFCVRCREGLELEHFARISSGGRSRTCRGCKAQVEGFNRARRLEQEGPAWRSVLAQAARNRRARDPKVRDRYREASKRWREKQDPVVLAEKTRMGRRLKREREGVSLDSWRSAAGAMVDEDRPVLPAAPLAAFVEGRLSRVDGSEDRACRDLGLEPRRLRSWRSGQYLFVRIDTAERVIVRAGVDWPEVYDPQRFPELYEAGAPLSDG